MDYLAVFNQLKKAFPDTEIYPDHPLAPYTTLKIGGPADIFIHTKNSEEFLSVLRYINGEVKDMFGTESSEQSEGVSTKNNFASQHITILGNGSNVLISDTGIRGIVIKNSSRDIFVLDSPISKDISTTPTTISTHRTENEPQKYLDFNSLDYDESEYPQVLVKFDSGVQLPFAIGSLIDKGITGLQWFAYIPATIGGAVYSNIHGGKYHFSDFIEEIEVFNIETNRTEILKSSSLSWDYDQSVFQQNPNLIIISVALKLYLGEKNRAKTTANNWIMQKSAVQSMNSAGSVFKNPTLEACLPLWNEQKSTGWIIDHELNLKGKTIGGAQISPNHANFIVNVGNATAQDYLELVRFIQKEVESKFGLKLEPEIKLLGEFT